MKQRIVVAFPGKIILIEDSNFKTVQAKVFIGTECSCLCIISLLEHIKLTRTINCLCELIAFNVSMPIDIFIKNYTYLDFLHIRNSGKESLADLRNALKKFGYEW